ncbi:MAG: PAS domain S-box protein, partial [Aromatoleum sp.]|nr:PAS domain S-box protein [Aromatoleum sp.]
RDAAESAHAASERRLREAQRVAHVGNWETDFTTGAMMWSDEIYRILELDPAMPPSNEAVIARMHPEDRETLTAAYAQRLRDHAPLELVGRLELDDGRTKWVRTRLETERDVDGTAMRGYGTLQDVTDLKSAEDALSRTEHLYRRLFMANPHPMWVYDLDTLRFLAVNDAAVDHYGYTREEFMARTLRDIRPPRELPRLLASTAQHRGSIAVPEVWQHLKKDGTVIEVEITANPLEFAGRSGALVHANDVTARRRAEQEVREYTARVEVAMLGTITAATRMVEMRDPYTAGHQQRVGELAAAIGSELRLAAEHCQALRLSGFLHDVGKIAVPAEILAKPGKLLDTEFAMIKLHAEKGFEILKDCELAWPVAEVARQHHERIDGSGYPHGRRGDEIILEARIVAIADVVESMSSSRPYRPSLGIEAALAEIDGGAGRLYDRAAAAACLRLFRHGYTLPPS